MKKNIYLDYLITKSVIALGLLLFLSGCNDEAIQSNQSISNSFVKNTYCENLGEGVDSIQEITTDHPILKKMLSTPSEISIDIKNIHPLMGIYYYNNGKASLLLSNQENTLVYAYTYELLSEELLDAQIWNFGINSESSLRSSMPNEAQDVTVEIKSMRTGEVIYNSKIESSEMKLKFQIGGYGPCMRKSMDELYNNWEKDPYGSTLCWFSGIQCLVGAVIYCLW